MKLVILGDTHGTETRVDLPEGDVLIHTGDFDVCNPKQLINLNNWFNSLDFENILFIGGNHDFHFQNFDSSLINSLFDKAHYLYNSEIEIEGKKFWGSPMTPKFHNWAFMYPRCSEEAKEIWSKIPENLDVLITHGPPYQILDKNFYKENCGCEVLQREVFLKNPKIHVFGHIHPANNSYPKHVKLADTNFYNVSVLNEDYELVYEPLVLEI